jgi:hypothetical protein
MQNNTSASQQGMQSLAQSIAQALNDTEPLGRYVVCCRKYPEHVIQKALRAAKAIPEAKIKKSRAALFFYFVKKYAHQTN